MNQHQVMALAALCQITRLVQKVAKYGQFNAHDVESFLQSIIITNPARPEDVYQDHYGLKQGYKALVDQLSADGSKDVELVKYVGGLIQLERVLAYKPGALDELGRRINELDRQLMHFSITDDTILSSLADIYSQVISPLGQRIQVFGQPELLKQPHIQHKVRALLLAGIRAAVLWRQMGGKRRHFFFSKRKIIAIAKKFVNIVQNQH
ncbi:high frequency lysogenization protein HflD [Pseudoalteromonas xiamenensis]|uniref:high frequency lysogenization protein HflD n=1 Tax=Pseudoalteromonas xiamenensis TaxID=882626 RepID=UPI0027E4E6B5|nr:high frequency lysogenization protein HflD [Pseudoalteromonas xiamenensis]WMN60146.1 high frequency lysogenization protein HflD [Pseudoalteromonas xiamenensis]